MPVWRFSGKEITKEEAQKAAAGLNKVCFECGVGGHSEDCPIMMLLLAMAMLGRED